MSYVTNATCLFCKIVKGDIPSLKLAETATAYAFMDIQPLSKGHALIIPKYHAEKLHELPHDTLSDILPMAVQIAKAIGCENYNILQV
ncbi:Hit family protein 1 [Neolecta irregularis DAH-3]|uniref:Hit family protein 1 n=1 Tax=Neolecta irregularis (strain DAH-3) TaxID=1198029 RepID=A0A1U7LTT0_NEOID|nr:Hit family protein 1 [Neolecta irregularis DAH-3]|eukprot:OLL25952.1 Hit family protein 1 [Neolecta irregularis DAH-3]